MKASRSLLVVPALANLVAAQESINFFSVIVSEANSVYTQVNSILSSAASAASAAAASATASSTGDTSTASASIATDSLATSDGTSSSAFSSSASSSSTSTSASSTSSYSSAVFGSINSPTTTAGTTSDTSSQTSSPNPSSKITSSLTLSTPIVGTSSVFGAAAETATGVPSSSGTSAHTNLAIILGCVLGALALGFFILTLVICCKRRRHGSSPRHSALSAGDDEVEAWRDPRAPGMIPSRGSSRHTRGISGAAPLMAEHPAYRSGVAQENPFAPVPPPPRRTAPNSRPGLTDGMIPGDDPFVNQSRRAPSLSSTSNSHHKGGIAAGIAAAAAGGALMHKHDKHEDEEANLTKEDSALGPPVSRRVSRKPVPVRHVNNGEPWPYSPVSPIDPAAEMAAVATKDPTRNSGDSRRSFSRDAARANAAFDQQYAIPQDGSGSHGHGLEAGLAGLAAGTAGGAALAHHADQERRRSRSSSSSDNNNRRTRPPLAALGDDSDHSSSSRNSRESRNSRGGRYTDAHAHVSQPPQETATPPQHGDLYGVPVAPPTSRSRTNSSGHGSAGPGAAMAFSHANRPTVPSPLSSEVRPDTRSGYSPPRSSNRARRSTSGGSRYSFPYEPMDYDYGAYPVFSAPPHAGPTQSYGNAAAASSEGFFPSLPSSSSSLSSSLPPRQPSLAATANPHPDKAIVGDNGYPHMNVLRRKSGVEYDLSMGHLGAQPPDEEQSELGTSRATAPMKSRAGGDDSTWRVSDGMPSGWQRASIDSPRNSRDLGLRDSGVGMNAGGKRRLRASDFAGRDDGPYHGLGQAL